MKTLVIHPKDRTTDFLEPIYKDKGFKVIRNRISDRDLLKEVEAHDRIIMLGHGTPNGLIGYMYLFTSYRFINVLRTKDCVCIWCNADQYVKRYNIKGFYTGMFISEVREARCYNIEATQEEIDHSNNLFSGIIKDYLDSPKILTETKKLYIGEKSPVIDFNNQRLYYRDKESMILEKEFDVKGEVKISDFDDDELLIN